MCTLPHRPTSVVRPLLLLLLLFGVTASTVAQVVPAIRVENQGASEEEIGRVFARLDASRIPADLLVDQVAILVDPTLFDGSLEAPSAGLNEWRQLYHQFSRSGVGRDASPHPRGGRAVNGMPSIDVVNATAKRHLDQGMVPLAVMNVPFARITPGALDEGLIALEGDQLVDRPGRGRSPYQSHRAFVVAPFMSQTIGRSVRFTIPDDLVFTRGGPRGNRYLVDFGDGRGTRSVRPGEVVAVEYPSGGEKEITLTAEMGTQTLTATTTFSITASAIPEPDLVWANQSAVRAFAGGVAGYDAYFFYGAGNSAPTRPVVFVEGFDPYYDDPANRRTWQDIYDILLQQDFVVQLRALGYDAVIMKLHNATDYVQRNAFALEHLLGRLRATMPKNERAVVVGPSMGGLIGRYALAYMEKNGIPHNVRLFASLDSPQQAANFPLGIQYFLEFNDGDSELAALGKKAVNSIAARQMLAYQYRAFPNVDPLRTKLVADLNQSGYPSTRNIAIANGSGTGRSQPGNERVGFREMRPGDKIIEYRYRSWYVDLDGDVWALPDQSPETRIFEGLKDVIGPHYRSQNVYVSGTFPFDNTPGGSRGTQREIADSNAPYGDIKTAFPDHSWIPTISALDLGTPDLNYNVLADPAGLTAAPVAGKRSSRNFDAIYYPDENQPHVFATNDNIRFLLDEIDVHFSASRTIAGARTFNSGQRVVVADGAVLTFEGPVEIASGVRFEMGRNATLLFKSAVTSLGTAADPVVFERASGGEWRHLDLSADGNLFEYTIFDGGNKTVEIRSRDNVFRYCVFRNGFRGVSSYYAADGGRSSFTLKNSIVEDNRSVGVVAYHAEPRFEHVTIRNNGQPGLWASDASTSVFYRSVVTGNARTQTTRSGVEILGGSQINFFSPEGYGGYTRIAGNTFHEVYATSSAGAIVFGLFGYGGYNAIYDQDEGSSAATELLLRNTSGRTIYADRTYWGDSYPDADDIAGPVTFRNVLTFDPTVDTPTPTLLASRLEETSVTVNAFDNRDQSELRRRMAEIRRILNRKTPGDESAELLRELFALQNLNKEDAGSEQAANRGVFAAWSAMLSSAATSAGSGSTPADAALRRAAEVAALLEIRGALLEERYEEVADLIGAAEPLIHTTEHRHALLLEKVNILEHRGRFADALATLADVRKTAAVEDPPELYAIIEETLLERLAGGGEQVATLSPSFRPDESTPAVSESQEEQQVTLGAGHPNPFNPVTSIPFTLARPAHVRIEVHDVLGRRVATLTEGQLDSGTHRVLFEASNLPSGLYLVRAQFRTEGEAPRFFTRRVTLMK